MEAPAATRGRLVLDVHEQVVRYREARMHVTSWYPEIPGLSRLPVSCAEAMEHADELRARLDADGVAHFQLDGLLTTDQYVALARKLGDPQPETAAEVARFVEDGVVLNLAPALEWSTDRAFEPFSWSAVRLHTEGSTRPQRRQPRYIVLHCVEPGTPTTGDQTVLVSMADIRERLTDAQMDLLSTVRLEGVDDSSPLAPAITPPVFCFRDFGADEIQWVCTHPEADQENVARAIVDLAVAMYTAPCYGVHWARHALVVIDNHRFFHGRTRGAGAHRHLRRIRVGQPGSS